MMFWRPTLAACAAALVVSAVLPVQAATAPAGAPAVAWQPAEADDDLERAFAQARAERKPLLLYWGAVWCPPCNQLKATLFNRADFIAASRGLVPVYIDGDKPGAQKLGARFAVRGYPTLVLLQPDGREITRLPGEAEPREVLRLLQLGLAGGQPVKAVLAQARSGARLDANAWRLLAFYGWDVDESQLVPAAERAGVLAELAAACPVPELATRLRLKALAANDTMAGLKADAALRRQTLALLADARAARAQADVLVNFAPEIATALAPEAGAERERVKAALEAALVRLQRDGSLSRGDRLSALASRVALARLEQPKKALQPVLPAALVAEVRRFAQTADREITDAHERQAVITGVAWVQGRAGLWADSDALLQASLSRSPAPHYLVSQLAGNAREQGRTDEALRLYERAAREAQGPAASLQWGLMYFNALVDLRPADEARIEAVAAGLLDTTLADGGAFHQRNLTRLQALMRKLGAWNGEGRHAAAFQRLQSRVQQACARQPASADAAARKACDGLLT